VLFTLDDVELTQQVEIARATVDSSHAAIDRLEADRAQAIAVLDQAQRRSDRVARLLESSALSEEEMDKATEALLIAEAGIARTAAALAEAQKELSVAEKTLAYHAARLADTQIAAPFDGLIVRRMRDPGDIVVPGSPTLTLIATEEIWITAWVDETEMARLQVGQPARVIFRSESNRSYQGTVARLGREADRETREFVVDVHVLALPENWAVGQRAEVYIETDRRQAAAIVPARFIHWKDEQPGVYRLAQQRALWQAVHLGLRDRERVEVIEGLEAGDVVLLAASVRSALTEGRRVASP
jgi:HlyD family secretion protein